MFEKPLPLPKARAEAEIAIREGLGLDPKSINIKEIGTCGETKLKLPVA